MRLALLTLHIVGGTVALLSGTFAVSVRKGSNLHRLSGNVFTIGMLTLATSGLVLAMLKSQSGNIIGSIVAFYMISTGWLAGHRRGIRRLDAIALAVGIGGLAAILTLVVETMHKPAGSYSVASLGMSSFFGVILVLSTAGDLRMLLRGGLPGRGRIMRHLWRMCFGLFIATGSFFLGQQQVFPVSYGALHC